MDKINWANYNYDEFESFCNVLFSYEFGKKYHPFSAAGRDGGIDGLFSGTYQEKSGEWRFQFKFYQSARSEAVSSLKYNLKKEVGKLKNEDHFILATNIELLPQEAKILAETFDEQIKNEEKDCEFHLIDGAKLYTLFIQYPILSLWLNDGFKTAQLRDYKEVFREGLDAQNFEPWSMSNFFIGRHSDLNNLETFLKSDKTLALIMGEAGIGKTRLILEFFKQRIDNLAEWTGLVLINRTVEFDKLYKALSYGRKYVVLIDDAHTYDARVIADMKAIVDSLKNVKLILTARSIEAFDSITLLREYEKHNILKIGLSELTRLETNEAFLRYIEGTSYKHYINQLVNISFGKPILIVAMLNAMSKYIQINQIKSQDFLKEYVKSYFKAFTIKVNNDIGIEKSESKQLLQVVALLEPFNFNDSKIIDKISSLLGLKQNATQTALKILVDNKYVNGRYVQSIKPDYYSDIILSDIDQNLVVSCLTEFSLFTSNIIINLSSVDEVINEDENNVLNTTLQIYIQLLENTQEINFVNKILSTVQTITFIKPNIAKTTVDLYLKCLQIEGHSIRKEFEENKAYNYFSTESALNKIISILNYLHENLENCDFVYRKAFKLFVITEEPKISNIFSFDKNDVISNFKMERQAFFIREFNKKYELYDKKKLSFGLLCLNRLTVLDFTINEWSVVDRGSFIISTYFLPAKVSVKKVREHLIELLIKVFRTNEDFAIRAEILKSIIDLPRGIFATERNQIPYHNENEIKIILKFLKTDVDTFNTIDRKEIIEKLYWFVRWGASPEMIHLINEVKKALKPKNLVERLSQLFSDAEIRILDIENIEEYIAAKCDEMIQMTDEQFLVSSIVDYLEQQPYPPHYYWDFQNVIEINYPSYAKKLHDEFYTRSMTLYSMYGSRILRTFYYHHHDGQFFFSQVKILQELNTPEADNVILSVFAQRVPEMTIVNFQDANLIIQIFNKEVKENDYMLSMAIQLLFAAKHPDALVVSKRFLTRTEQRHSENFFIRISNNNTVTSEQITDLIINHTLKYSLTYAIEKCLKNVLKEKGTDVVFNYLVKRFEFKKYIFLTQKTFYGYEFVPDGEHSHLFEQLPNYKLPMFKKALQWYVNVDEEGVLLSFAKNMLDYLQPSQNFGQTISDYYREQIEKFKFDGVRLERIIESLSIFHHKDETFVQLIVDSYEYINDFQDNDVEQYKRLHQECYAALTEVGVKSGSLGQPFQVDIDLKNLIESFLTNLQETLTVTQLLKDVIKSINANIEGGLDRDNLTW